MMEVFLVLSARSALSAVKILRFEKLDPFTSRRRSSAAWDE
jgi:hypothetical protein